MPWVKLTEAPRTVWPSGLRRWLQAPVRKGVGSNPTAVMLVSWGGLAHARLGLACVHRAAVDRRRRRATYREVKLRRHPLRQLAERPGARHQVACRVRIASKTMPALLKFAVRRGCAKSMPYDKVTWVCAGIRRTTQVRQLVPSFSAHCIRLQISKLCRCPCGLMDKAPPS